MDLEVADPEGDGALERGEQRGVLGDVVGGDAEVDRVLLAPAVAELEDHAAAGLAGVAAAPPSTQATARGATVRCERAGAAAVGGRPEAGISR